MKDLIQKQKIDTQNIIFKISFRTKSLRFEFRRETRRIHFQYPSHDDHFRRETPRNFAEKFLLFLAVSPRNCQFRVCSFRVSPRKMRFLNCADCIIHVIGVYFQIIAEYFKADLENVLVCCLSTDLPFCAPTGFSIIYFVPF